MRNQKNTDTVDELLLHQRRYNVDVYRVDRSSLRLRGTVTDDKPAHLHFPGDPKPLRFHKMIVDLIVDASALTITAVDVVFETHPHKVCPRIIDHYDSLIGASIGRGFSRTVRELFGGPSGCTHTNALLLAMAPVCIQAIWSLNVVNERERPVALPGAGAPADAADPPPVWLPSVNTCHVWDDNGEFLDGLRRGTVEFAPGTFVERARELGLDEQVWRDQL